MCSLKEKLLKRDIYLRWVKNKVESNKMVWGNTPTYAFKAGILDANLGETAEPFSDPEIRMKERTSYEVISDSDLN